MKSSRKSFRSRLFGARFFQLSEPINVVTLSAVEIAERVVDELYRELEIKILSSKFDFPALILLRDVLQLLEDSADKAEDAADAARILSFMM